MKKSLLFLVFLFFVSNLSVFAGENITIATAGYTGTAGYKSSGGYKGTAGYSRTGNSDGTASSKSGSQSQSTASKSKYNVPELNPTDEQLKQLEAWMKANPESASELQNMGQDPNISPEKVEKWMNSNPDKARELLKIFPAN